MASIALGATWPDYVQAIAAAAAVLAVILIPLTAYARRPRLSLQKDTEGVHSQVEGNAIPYIRLLIGNDRRRRAAQGARVLAERYRDTDGTETRSMGSPELHWPSSVNDGAAIVFAGGKRPLDFAYLVPAHRDMYDRVIEPDHAEESPATTIAKGGEWQLRLALAHDLFLVDQREYLAPLRNGYAVRLVVGADDGPARAYDVDVNWDGKASAEQEALDSVQIAVRRVRPV